MTKEELKQKARDFVREYLRDNLILDEYALVQFATEVAKDLEQQIEKMKCCGNCTKGNCVNIGQKGKACTYWTSNKLRR
jgi:NADH:ubiquinone oxidoreductase subunit E